jgi:uncharacterized protein (TIGR03435 family)
MIRIVLAAALAASCSFSQPTSFDTASVKVVDLTKPPTGGISGGPGSSDPGRIHFGRATMEQLLERAYGVASDQVSGPPWISDFMGKDFYEVTATLPPGTTKEQFQIMMQNLLAERFHLVIHREPRNYPGYELSIAKDGPKLKESAPDPAVAADAAPQHPTFAKDGSIVLPRGPQALVTMSAGKLKLKYQEQSLTTFVKNLGAMVSQTLGVDAMELRTPRARVIDKTGLSGKYDFTLECACAGCRGLSGMMGDLPKLREQTATAANPEPNGLPNIFVALEKQLGLNLEKTRDVPLDVIVVDRVDKVPTAN